LKLLTEAAAKRWEREHNARVWLAWHTAALSRIKKMPDIKKMILTNTDRPRQSWQQQLAIFAEFAARKNAYVKRQEEIANGG
jgi:hypothetical protein